VQICNVFAVQHFLGDLPGNFPEMTRLLRLHINHKGISRA
jgi:hypothetical protein